MCVCECVWRGVVLIRIIQLIIAESENIVFLYVAEFIIHLDFGGPCLPFREGRSDNILTPMLSSKT